MHQVSGRYRDHAVATASFPDTEFRILFGDIPEDGFQLSGRCIQEVGTPGNGVTIVLGRQIAGIGISMPDGLFSCCTEQYA